MHVHDKDGPQDLQVVEELHTVCFRGKHSVIPVLLVAGVFVDFISVDHRHCLRKVFENRCKRNNTICIYSAAVLYKDLVIIASSNV